MRRREARDTGGLVLCVCLYSTFPCFNSDALERRLCSGLLRHPQVSKTIRKCGQGKSGVSVPISRDDTPVNRLPDPPALGNLPAPAILHRRRAPSQSSFIYINGCGLSALPRPRPSLILLAA